jgi:ferredoxin-NADP reductase
VYMCGPPPMTKAFRDGFLGIGIPRSRLRWEEFAAR